jgi:hypothetical protein
MNVTAFRAIAVLLVGWSCSAPTRVIGESRAHIESLTAPDAVPAATPLVVTIAFVRGACDEVIGASGRVDGQVLEVEVRLRETIPPGGACPDIAIGGERAVTFAAPPVGQLVVRGLQPGGEPPIERQVIVGQ